MNQPHEVTVSAGPGSVSSAFSPALLLALSSLAYYLAQVLAFQFPDSFGLLAAIWPAAGIALASLLLCPRRLWPALLACLFTVGVGANLTTERSVLASVGFMIANITETAASAWLITRFCGDRVAFNRVREVISLAGASIFVNAATALLGAKTAHLAIGAKFWNFYWTWWIADGLGLLLVTPLIVVWARSGPIFAGLRWFRSVESVGLIVFSGIVAFVEFGSKTEFSAIELAPFWLPVLLIWAALRCGPLVTATLLGVFALITIGCTAGGLGTFPLGGINATLQLQSVQAYLGVMGATGLIVATAVAQQKASQTLLRAVVEGTSDSIYVKDRQGRYLLFNSAASRFVGKAAADVIGYDDTHLFASAEAKALYEVDQVAMAAGEPWTYEEHLTGGSGKALDFFTTKGPLRDESGAVTGLFGIARDITERKRTETALHQSEEWHRTIIETAINGFWLADTQGRILEVNEAYCRMSGFSAPEILKMRIADFEANESPEETLAHIREIMASGEDRFESKLRRKDGTVIDVEINAQYRPMDGGRMVVFLQDITTRKQAETALRVSEERYRSVIETSLDGVLFATIDGQILAANAAACRMFACSEEDFRQMGRAGTVDTSDPRLALALAERSRTGNFRGELTFIRKGGLRFPGEVSTAIFTTEDGIQRSSIIVRDITERKQAETALRESEEKFAKVFRRAPVLIVLSDIEKETCIEVNEEVLRLSGFTREEVIGRTSAELGWLNQEARTQLAIGVQQQGRVDDWEMVFRTKTGELRTGLVNAESILIGGRPCLLTVTVDITEHVRTETMLRESEEKFAKAFRDSPVPMAIRDLETDRYLDVNDRCLAMTGYDRAEVVGHSPMEIGWMAEADRAANQLSLSITGSVTDRELRLRRKDGDTLICSYSTHVIPIGGRSCVLSTSIDITARKQAEEALEASERNYRRLFDGMLDGFALHEIICDDTGRPVDYRFLSVNPAFERLTGLHATNTVGRTVREIMPQTELGWIERYGRVAQTGEGVEFEEFSGVLQKHFKIAAFRPNPGQFATVFIDITEQKRAEAALRASEQRYRTILNASPDDITIADLQGRVLLVSPAGMKMFGYEKEEQFLLRPVIEGLAPADRAVATSRIALMFQGVMPGVNQYRGQRRDGSTFDMEVNSDFVRDTAGQPTHIIFVARDITARKEAEAKIALSASKLLAALNASPLPHVLNDDKDNTTFLNAAFVRTFGYTLEDIPVLEAWWPKAYPDPQYRTEVAKAWQDALDESNRTGMEFVPMEVNIRCKDGTEKTVLVRTAPLTDTLGGERLVVMQDITERKAAEVALVRANDRLSLAARAGGVGIWDYDVRNNRLIWDEEMYRLYGITADQFEAAYATWQKGVHPDDRARGDAEIQAALRGEKEFDTEFRALWPDGSVHYIRALSLVKRDAQGQPVNMIGTNWDITAQKQVEAALQSTLHEKEALLKEVHHRVKNNLQVITSLLRLESGRSKQPAAKSVLEDMQGRIRSMATLHEALYRSGTFAAVDLGVYLKQITTQLFRALATPGAIQLHLDLAAVPIEMDQAMPCGLLVNELVSNALKHGFPAGRTGEVRVELHRVAGGPELRLCVSDTGVGLPADLETSRSQSLGLQLVGDLARQVDGILETGSGPGTSFTITFTPRMHSVGSNPPIKVT